jgi:16S rRNA (cytosine967-C5)-methyltransferase
MRLHRPLLLALSAACTDIFQEGTYADKAVERLLKSNPKWGSRDRAFLAENTYEIVRWKRLLEALCGLPPGADGQHFFRLAGVNLILKNVELPDWEEFKGLNPKAIFEKRKALATDRKIAQSIPDWLDEVGAAELGEKWPVELAALNQTAPVVLRANTLKTNPKELKKLLAADAWESQETLLAPDALVLEKRGNIFQNSLFKQGYFEVQDAGSQAIAPFLQVEPGMRVVDACAGAGGKSLHLAALMQNKGSIIALDTEAWKLTELQRRARRNGVHILQTRPIESTKTIKRLHGTADRLLLDVPCSGLGTLRRNPDAKWKLSPEFLERVRATQAEILCSYSRILKPGGKMVYATCSILPSENERQVERFLSENKDFKLLAERHISPAMDGFDGFYMALLEMDK